MRLLTLDIGGTKLAAARWSPAAQGRGLGTLEEVWQVPTPQTLAAFDLALADLRRRCEAQGDMPCGVAVAATGVTDGQSMRAINPHTLPFWHGLDLRQRLQRCFEEQSVHLLNDAQAAAWGEYVAQTEARGTQSPDSGACDLFFLTLSTGVGAGLVLDGRLRLGGGLAGHLGHTDCSLAPLDGWTPCGCGQNHCLENLVSGTALARQASRMLGAPTSTRQMFELMRQGNAAMGILLEHATHGLARSLVGVRMTLGVERVVLGGSVGLQPETQNALERALQRQPDVGRIAVRPAVLGAQAGLIGAAHHMWLQTQTNDPGARGV